MQQTKSSTYFPKIGTMLDRVHTSDQTSVTGTDGFSLYKNGRKLKDYIQACTYKVSACGDGAVPQCQPKCSALGSKQSECVAREITRNLALQRNKKTRDKDRRTLGTYMKMFENEDFKLPLTADGFYCLSGDPRRAYSHWCLAKREFGKWHTPFFAFLVFLVFPCTRFFYTIYSLIACSGVSSFYFENKK